MTILVTGGAGFIGSAIVRHISAQGLPVVSGTRRSPAGGQTRSIPCDLDDAHETSIAVSATSSVVHAAYGDAGAMRTQCRTLLDAMSGARVNVLIHISSIAVYGQREGHVDPSMQAERPLEGYAAAKRDCENLVRAWSAAEPSRRALIVRPGIVYGRSSHLWIDKMAARIRGGAWGSFGPGGEGLAALIHVDDLARLVAMAAAGTWTGCEAVNAVGPETITWNDYFRRLATAIGHPALPELSPAGLALRRGVGVIAKIWRRSGLPGFETAALAPAKGEMALFRLAATYDMAAARSLFDFTPSISLDEGLARSL